MQEERSKWPWFMQDPLSAIETYKKADNYVVLDVETTNKDFGSAVDPENELLLACWDVVKDGTITRKSKWGNEYEMAELEEDIMAADFLVTWNAKFELQWLRRCGLDLHNILNFDGYLNEWVIQSNRFRANPLGLNATAQRYGMGQKLDRVSYLIGKGFCPSEIPAEWLEEYCFKDVELTRLVVEKQLEILEEKELLHLALTRNLLVPVLADMEFSPQHLDREEVSKLYEQKVNEFIELENRLGTFTDGINLNSPKQKIEFFYETMGFAPPKDRRGNPITTKTGSLSTDADTLALLKPKNNKQREFLELYERRNKLNTELTKNLSFFKAAVEELDGKFYGIFNQGFTDTGRLSSSGRKVHTEMLGREAGPQLQNLPRHYKYLFATHDEDTEVWSWDAAQLEFRVAANIGQDAVAKEEIVTGFDVHSYTAKVLTEAGEPTDRQHAKASTFAPLYGGGGRSPAQMEYAKAFKLKYAGISSTQEGWTHRVLRDKELVLPWGARFYWPNISMGRSGYISNTTQIYNYPVQALATAEIIPLALVFFWHYTKGQKVELFNTVHDSIVARVHKDVDKEWLKRVVVQSMTHDVFSWLDYVYEYPMEVPLGVGLKIGPAWDVSDTELEWSVSPSGEEVYKEKS